jgi:hypothetical protein
MPAERLPMRKVREVLRQVRRRGERAGDRPIAGDRPHGVAPTPHAILCTLRNHCRQRPRNTCCQAGAAPYSGRTSTGWIAPACLAHSFDHLVRRASSVAGTSIPSARAVLTLITISNWLAARPADRLAWPPSGSYRRRRRLDETARAILGCTPSAHLPPQTIAPLKPQAHDASGPARRPVCPAGWVER